MPLNREYVKSMRGDAVSFSSELLTEVGHLLCERVLFLVRSHVRDVLILGSRDGAVTARMCPHLPVGCVIYQCDVAYSIVCTALRYGYGIVVDDGCLPFKAESFDIVVSNLNLHNVADLSAVFGRIFSLLRFNGIFVAALLGSRTLLDVKKAMIAVDGKRVVPRIRAFNRVYDVINCMQSCGFSDVVADISVIEIKYRDLDHIFRDLRDMGEGGIFLDSEPLSASALSEAWNLYKRSLCMESEEVAPVQFEVILLMGKKKEHRVI